MISDDETVFHLDEIFTNEESGDEFIDEIEIDYEKNGMYLPIFYSIYVVCYL